MVKQTDCFNNTAKTDSLTRAILAGVLVFSLLVLAWSIEQVRSMSDLSSQEANRRLNMAASRVFDSFPGMTITNNEDAPIAFMPTQEEESAIECTLAEYQKYPGVYGSLTYEELSCALKNNCNDIALHPEEHLSVVMFMRWATERPFVVGAETGGNSYIGFNRAEFSDKSNLDFAVQSALPSTGGHFFPYEYEYEYVNRQGLLPLEEKPLASEEGDRA